MTQAVHASLEQHFDTAFSAPDGIAKLRELILTLAMQGKLVPQDPNDPPASELLKEIEAEKRRLVEEKKIKKPKLLPPIKLEEVPYELPEGWEWVRLGEIGVINPRNNAEDSIKAGFVPMPMIPEGYSEEHQFEERTWSDVKKGYTHLADSDVGMAKITPCFENAKSCVFSGLPNGLGAGTTELHIFRNTFNAVLPRFLLYYLKNPHYISKTVPYMTGSAGQKRVPTPYFTEQLFPLPSLSEQQRIVARIDQLMARCDELEKLRKEREEVRLKVHAAAIKQLLDAPDAGWPFIQQHFSELYTVKENVAELRKAILQLAVIGRLVPQDSNDPPACELLKEIEAEKQRLVDEKKIKKLKPLPPIKPEEVPYQLPRGWEWVRLQDVLDVRDGTHDSPKDAVGSDTYPLITSKNFSNGRIDFSEARMISSEDHFEITKRSKVDRLDILFSMIGGNIGNQVIVQEDREFSIKNVALFKYYDRNLTYPYFIKRFMEHIAADLQQKAVGGAQPFVSLGFLRNIVFGLPPINEQYHIVARIDELMALCDKLDQQIEAASCKQSALLNSVMAQV
ncbi:Restriction modification system DNA specificity domain [Nitrosococcus oceani ATCC 19707]|uniref:Restriction modification system DNA specificity domain n=2 Tax=Nitrosococcus oceani TaxID=1229 RepID=Q3J6S5_NITOC|nr:restriction endonuclease subunit S [Nitrosococcus oceani]ABA59471.1 Restriction modification system DNA specificity domain [Nitrosococcus oceani ATCC 19707]EDZ66617.1 Type I restriction modification DNA specificity domain protein [Nitrosococcus oceani AFC27]KFI18037.1 restriction endonuclease [Nitrosococcus oceani C-27]GEM21403.1 restriction endonuclease [Nitrosococcus oceani]